MKKLIVILLICPVFAFSQRNTKSITEPWDKWDWINYAEDVSRENSKYYLVEKLIQFQKHCKTDTVIFPVTDWDKVLNSDSVFKKAPIKYYVYKHPEPTFEYFIEWLQKHK